MIDASKAIERLGLKYPVEFVFTSLNPGGPMIGSLFTGGVADGQTRPQEDGHHEIMLDLDAVHYGSVDLRTTVAHELWHCKQFEDAGNYRKAMARIIMTKSTFTYANNPDELEAEAHVEELKSLITVSGCEGDGVTHDEAQVFLDQLEGVLALGDIDSELEYDDPVFDEADDYDDDFEDA